MVNFCKAKAPQTPQNQPRFFHRASSAHGFTVPVSAREPLRGTLASPRQAAAARVCAVLRGRRAGLPACMLGACWVHGKPSQKAFGRLRKPLPWHFDPIACHRIVHRKIVDFLRVVWMKIENRTGGAGGIRTHALQHSHYLAKYCCRNELQKQRPPSSWCRACWVHARQHCT
jgi:hypothetical protein